MTTAFADRGRDVTRQGENPAVLPAGLEQSSLDIDFRRAAEQGLTFDGIPVPVELHQAVPVRQIQFLAGRFCALDALRRLDPSRPSHDIGRAERGAPLWPSGIVGSITHTDGFVSAAVGRENEVRGVGIDSENIVSAEQAQRVSRLVSWPSELAHAREAGLDRMASLTLVFSAKEAIFKCLYPLVRDMFYYHDVRIVAVEPAARRFHARLVKTLSADFPADMIIEGRFAISNDSRVHTGVVLTAC